ncbi:MAG TPA: ribosome biogenesis GTP-binding protein YihA/YsxC [Casimicrobiaceae bacterium]|nr:ribosome biogenesis GTP-binding protein YihA/YsxC [Casimicrobiaceae bacterium]
MTKRNIVPEPDRAARAGPERVERRAPQVLVGATFVNGAAARVQLPESGPPEIAFAGRSNAGKSSAINALANRTRLAFASRTPGRTQQINFFALRSGGLVADLPGYGYAAVAKEVKKSWQDFLWEYVSTRSTLVGLVLVADARHGLKALDLALLGAFLPSGRPVLVLATKSDKLNNAERRDAVRGIEAQLAAAFPGQAPQATVVAFSATTRAGVEAADATLAGWLGLDAPPTAP